MCYACLASCGDTMHVAGGYLLAYENDNIYAKDVTIALRLSKLVMVLEYPKKANETVQMWIQL